MTFIIFIYSYNNDLSSKNYHFYILTLYFITFIRTLIYAKYLKIHNLKISHLSHLSHKVILI